MGHKIEAYGGEGRLNSRHKMGKEMVDGRNKPCSYSW